MKTYSRVDLQKHLSLTASTLQLYLRDCRLLIPDLQPEYSERGTHRYPETLLDLIRQAHRLCQSHRGLSRFVALQQILSGVVDPLASPEGATLQAILREVLQSRAEDRQSRAALQAEVLALKEQNQELRVAVQRMLHLLQDRSAQGTLWSP